MPLQERNGMKRRGTVKINRSLAARVVDHLVCTAGTTTAVDVSIIDSLMHTGLIQFNLENRQLQIIMKVFVQHLFFL